MIDLHIHSKYSADGTSLPAQIVQKAKERGLSTISLTEHENIGSLKQINEASCKGGLNCVSGIEIGGYLSIDKAKKVEVHILGYCFKSDSRPIQL